MADHVMRMPADKSNAFFKPAITPVTTGHVQMIQRISANDSPAYEDAQRDEQETSVQTKLADGLLVQRLTAKNTSGGPDRTGSNVAPWGGANPKGDDYNVYTDAGTRTSAWVAIEYQSDAERYWCHGHSLGTYRNWMYSVYSGTGMQNVVADEYNTVAEANVQSGDIAVWEPSFGHSCKIESPARNGSALDVNATGVSSKNGRNPLANTSLANVMQVYASLNNNVVYHRHK